MTITFDDFNDRQIYHYKFATFLGQDLRKINGPCPNPPAIAPPDDVAILREPFRVNTKYFSLTMHINARGCYSDCNIPGGDTRKVVLRLFHIPHSTIAGMTIPPTTITGRNIREVGVIIKELTAPRQAVQSGIFQDNHNNIHDFHKWLTAIKDHAKFEMIKKLIVAAYIGTEVIDTTTLRMQRLRQEDIDSNRRKNACELDAHFQCFQQLLAEFDSTQPYSLDLAYIILNFLTPSIRGKCIRDGYNPPQNSPMISK